MKYQEKINIMKKKYIKEIGSIWKIDVFKIYECEQHQNFIPAYYDYILTRCNVKIK